MSDSKWLRCRLKRPQAIVYLVCFPWAGGGAAYYVGKWTNFIPNHAEVHGVCLPGRESRFVEPCITTWHSLVKELSGDIHKLVENSPKPVIFWGHSMGAMLCFETARHLKVHYGLEPSHLLISGASAPQAIRKSDRTVSEISNDQLAEKIKNWGGTPKAVLDNKEIMKISVKILRADLTLIENYRFIPDDSCIPMLSCPITCFDGNEDLRDQQGWSEMSTGRFIRHVLPGGHFYFMNNIDNETKLVDIITKDIIPNSEQHRQ